MLVLVSAVSACGSSKPSSSAGDSRDESPQRSSRRQVPPGGDARPTKGEPVIWVPDCSTDEELECTGEGDGSDGFDADPPDPMDVLTEVVYVLMTDVRGRQWMCTGVLVSRDIAVTAAHCIDDAKFRNWQIVAPLDGRRPRVSASRPVSWSKDYDNVAQPDVGFLRLDEPIELPAYAQLTDVTPRVDAGEKVMALAIVRQSEKLEAPFMAVSDLVVWSTTNLGYLHGFGTPMFSRGGDSGAGLFLVENGRATHKLIGIVRQPEPDTNLDHSTRVDARFIDWFEANAAR